MFFFSDCIDWIILFTLLNLWYHVIELKKYLSTGLLSFATKRTKRRHSCKSPIDDVEANVEVSKDKIFSQPKCTH
jgi:hypothetical protein